MALSLKQKRFADEYLGAVQEGGFLFGSDYTWKLEKCR